MKRLLLALLGCLACASVADAALISRLTTWTDGQVLTHSALNNEFDEAFDEINGNLNAANLSATLTFADSDFIDLSAINMSGTGEGLKLGAATSLSSATAEGQIGWDTDDDALCVGDGSANNCLHISSDLNLRQANPTIALADSTDNVGYIWHLETASGQAPWDYLTLWRGASTGTTNFTVSPNVPLLHFNSSNEVRMPLGVLRLGSPNYDGQLVIFSAEGTGGNQSVTINPNSNMTQDVTYTLPANDGDASQFLQTDGSGSLSWAAASKTVLSQTTTSLTADRYFPLCGGSTDMGDGTEGNVDHCAVPFAGTLKNLYCSVTTAPGGGTSWAITVRDDASDTSVTCTISNTSTTCNDTSNTATVAAASLLTIFWDANGGVAGASLSACMAEYDPT